VLGSGIEMVFQPSTQKLFVIISTAHLLPIIGTDRLTLNGNLDFFVFHLFSQGSIKIMHITTASGRWPSPPIKKHHIHIILPRHPAKFLFCTKNRPNGTDITSILCPVGKSHHDGLLIFP